MVVYRYQVPKGKTRKYIVIEKKVIAVYSENGCLGVEIFRDAKDPRYWMEINRFRDRKHYEEFVGVVGKDPRIESLTKEFMALFDGGEYQPEKKAYFKMI